MKFKKNIFVIFRYISFYNDSIIDFVSLKKKTRVITCGNITFDKPKFKSLIKKMIKKIFIKPANNYISMY